MKRWKKILIDNAGTKVQLKELSLQKLPSDIKAVALPLAGEGCGKKRAAPLSQLDCEKASRYNTDVFNRIIERPSQESGHLLQEKDGSQISSSGISGLVLYRIRLQQEIYESITWSHFFGCQRL